MQITFESIVKIYLTVVLFISLLVIVDRLTERESKPIILGGDMNPTVLVIRKGCIFHQRWDKL